MATQQEEELMSLLDNLEKSNVSKGGDALANQPHDGGFATEGTNIQAKAKAKSKVMKALKKAGYTAEKAEMLFRAMGAADDDSSSADESSDSVSSDDGSGESPDDDSSSADDEDEKKPSFGKSTGAAQLANATSRNDDMRKALLTENPEAEKAFDAAPIFGQLVDMLSKGNKISKSQTSDLMKSIGVLTTAGQESRQLNLKIAKGLVLMAGMIGGLRDDVAKISAQPVQNNRTPTLRKGDIVEPDFHDSNTHSFDGRGTQSPLHGVELLKIQETLVDLCMKGEAELMDVTKFENSKNLTTLPPQVVARLEKRLCPAS